jgi:hypothetical protein
MEAVAAADRIDRRELSYPAVPARDRARGEQRDLDEGQLETLAA